MIQAGSARGVFQSGLQEIPGEGRNSLSMHMDVCPGQGGSLGFLCRCGVPVWLRRLWIIQDLGKCWLLINPGWF